MSLGGYQLVLRGTVQTTLLHLAESELNVLMHIRIHPASLYDAAHAHASHRQGCMGICLSNEAVVWFTSCPFKASTVLTSSSYPYADWSSIISKINAILERILHYVFFLRYAFWQILAMALFWNLMVCTLWWTVLSWSFSFFSSLTDLDNDLRASQRGFLSWLHVLKEFLLGQKGYFQNVPTL